MSIDIGHTRRDPMRIPKKEEEEEEEEERKEKWKEEELE